jgi:hypothetical protein
MSEGLPRSIVFWLEPEDLDTCLGCNHLLPAAEVSAKDTPPSATVVIPACTCPREKVVDDHFPKSGTKSILPETCPAFIAMASESKRRRYENLELENSRMFTIRDPEGPTL